MVDKLAKVAGFQPAMSLAEIIRRTALEAKIG
jgi:hypothetical protein